MQFLKIMRPLVLLLALPAAASAVAQTPPKIEVLTGDEGDACAALLCLAGAKPPSECDPALSRFFGIKKKKLSDTLDARQDFLAMCPSVGAVPGLSELAKALARGAGRCDAGTLNQTLSRTVGTGGDAGTSGTYISNVMPTYCAAYILHEYTNFKGDMPRYVGKPEEDGFWAEANNYPAALARYEREQAAKKAARENTGWEGN
ncbi:TrbM/KikA/MpfK family conjugal transfer protein [Achromobacter xylosoxidans]|uniref:TrbM/KikA/MpfK family conjugal transfer protein n=1 Tax=Alcaligenes xylosoxydans xylosoxydans TaxID=85698 RepID=UPI001F13D20D|nr:TrbM/KikA/MpfK family conjugal transfer protein [Achromobacter xylosoxidans]